MPCPKSTVNVAEKSTGVLLYIKLSLHLSISKLSLQKPPFTQTSSSQLRSRKCLSIS
jgi:hypothetical protein